MNGSRSTIKVVLKEHVTTFEKDNKKQTLLQLEVIARDKYRIFNYLEIDGIVKCI